MPYIPHPKRANKERAGAHTRTHTSLSSTGLSHEDLHLVMLTKMLKRGVHLYMIVASL